jgi:hypothetical protein
MKTKICLLSREKYCSARTEGECILHLLTSEFPTCEYQTETKKAYMPVPYNMQFELSIMSKLNDDALQIVEQILPYFQPSYNITVNLVSSINEKRDIPIVLENITMQDDYEGNFTTRRVLIYTLRFSAKNPTITFGLPSNSVVKASIKAVSNLGDAVESVMGANSIYIGIPGKLSAII